MVRSTSIHDNEVRVSTEVHRELGLLRFLSTLEDRLNHVRDAETAMRVSHRQCREFFGVEESCIAVIERGGAGVELRDLVPKDVEWDRDPLLAFLKRQRPRLTPDLLLADVPRRGRPWATICLRKSDGRFDTEAVAEIQRIGEKISTLIQRIDRWRLADARMRIDQKIMEQLRPQDLFYQILHSLRSLTHYDHSAALLTHEPGPGTLDVVAEQIAWRKGKSRKIGLTLPLDEPTRLLLASDDLFGFDRDGDGWKPWKDARTTGLADLLDYNREEDGQDESSLLCAPLRTRDSLLGVLKISSLHSGSLGRYEAKLVQRFLPQAVVAISNLRRTESLELGMLQAEKKHVMADLARGVSHDINNAFGAVMPLVQQMIADARAGGVSPDVLVRDLEQILASLRVCRRIFGGLLAFARGSARTAGDGDVRLAVENSLAVLEERIRRGAIRVRSELGDELPLVRSPQGDLEQLLLNLATNACDAMPRGGELVVRATGRGGQVEIEIADTGDGISREHLARVQEPFFTTKPHGNGLGLSICRSIAWQHRGRLAIDSGPGKGTLVRVTLPAVGAAPEERT